MGRFILNVIKMKITSFLLADMKVHLNQIDEIHYFQNLLLRSR